MDDWLRWSELRNRFAHEYSDQPELRFGVLKAAIGAAGEKRSLGHDPEMRTYVRWKDRIGRA